MGLPTAQLTGKMKRFDTPFSNKDNSWKAKGLRMNYIYSVIYSVNGSVGKRDNARYYEEKTNKKSCK